MTRLYLPFLLLFSLLPLTANAQSTPAETDIVRFATFNVSMYREQAGQLVSELSGDEVLDQPQKIAEIIQRVRPDVLLLNEFDYDRNGEAIAAFRKQYLEVAQNDQAPIVYPYMFAAPANTGVDSEVDLDDDGKTGTPNDCFGFGRHPGQYGMVVLSRFPIERNRVRTFQRFLWKDMPGNLMPVKPGTSEPYYSESARKIFRLSSKSHWDVPIKVKDQTIHMLAAHPTPPVFDGDEDRNGRRNHDEIRLLADYVSPGKAGYLYDDQGHKGGLAPDASFVIVGDLNADPVDGDSSQAAAKQLTEHPRINHTITPSSAGGSHFAKVQGQQNDLHQGPAKFDTGDFRDSSVGNLRLDYCLPSKDLSVRSAGVYWPTPDQPGYEAVTATDHRMVWIDIELGE